MVSLRMRFLYSRYSFYFNEGPSRAVFDGKLYVATLNEVTGCEVWSSQDPAPGNWDQVNTDGFGDFNNHDALSMAVFDGNFYVGTYNPVTGCEVWRLEPVDLTLTPDSTTVPRGGTLGLGVTVTNNTDQVQIFFFATNVTLPNGNIYPSSDYLFGPYRVGLDPYQSKSGHLSHTIPSTAPLGTYTYHGYIGTSAMDIWDEDHFDFEVTEPSAVLGPEDWETTVDQGFIQ